MQLGYKGARVQAVQWALLAHGYDLPRWGTDGVLGAETWQALADFAADRGLEWSSERVESGTSDVPSAIIEAVLADDPQVPAISSVTPPEVVDLTPSRGAGPPPKTKRDAHGNAIRRPPATVDGITIHQTACVFGVTPRQVSQAGGDATLALHHRFLNVACHVAALRTGDVLKTNDFRTYVYHGNGLNSTTLGLEVEGIYPGSLSKPKSPVPGKALTPLTTTTIDAARRALKFMVDEGRAAGMPIEWLFAHRQSSVSRRPDPGEEIWKRVVLEYAVPVLGLKVRPEFRVGTGLRIPKAWDPNGIGPY